jgi:hypothetical protein
MTVIPVTPEAPTADLLAGATFADAYRLVIHEARLDAETATRRVMSRMPKWIDRLMRWRNVLVAPLGLKAAPDADLPETAGIGAFPVISRSPGRIVLGLDDSHLDFRIAIDVLRLEADRHQITATTVVRPHNLLGRAYLAAVLPFHRVIVPAMLAKAATP